MASAWEKVSEWVLEYYWVLVVVGLLLLPFGCMGRWDDRPLLPGPTAIMLLGWMCVLVGALAGLIPIIRKLLAKRK